MRRAWCALLPVLLAACGSKDTTGPSGPDSTLAFTGGDISALEKIEQSGGVFRNAGMAGDAIAVLRAQGSTTFRLRVFVNPSGADVQVNDLAYTIRMAMRIKAAGAKLLLDFHYSDTWADPGHQAIPAAWAALPFDSLGLKVESYTSDVIAQLKANGALPDIVQIGNEVDAGILWPQGQLAYDADSSASWDHFTSLLEAGIQGVHDAESPGDSVRIMVHYSQGGSVGGAEWFFDHLRDRGVPFDLIGLSYYPWWHGTLLQLTATLNAVAARYGKSVMVVETAYPWRSGGWEGMATNQAPMTWAVSQAGQQAFLRDVVNAVGGVPGGRGAGVLWWYPESILVTGLSVWGGGSLALFDGGGNVLPAASVF